MKIEISRLYSFGFIIYTYSYIYTFEIKFLQEIIILINERIILRKKKKKRNH